MTLSTRTRITAAPPSPALSSRSRLWPLSLSQCQQQADSRMAQRPSFADALANTGLKLFCNSHDNYRLRRCEEGCSGCGSDQEKGLMHILETSV
ncbi:hypothetical protein K1719_028261 [Acacia pycnantha]|nr:hypothetical protein K1719_028261 [Acacia pycnantha]